MSWNLYALLPEETLETFHEDPASDPSVIKGYPYKEVPYIGAKHVQGHGDLPPYLINAVQQEHTAAQAEMYGEALKTKATGLLFEGRIEGRDAGRLVDIGDWLIYWGRNGVRVEGSP